MRRLVTRGALVALLIVDVGLLVWLSMWTSDQRHSVPDVPVDSTPATSVGPTPAGAVTMTSSGPVLFRITQGTCAGDGRPMLEKSTDTGGSFSEVALPVLSPEEVVRTVLAARATSPTELLIMAGDAACEPQGYLTTDGGVSWTEANFDDWYVDASGESVVGPAGASSPGCQVRSLSIFSERNVKVLCADTTIRGTNDAGERWVVLGELDDATAVHMTGLFEGFGVAVRPECASQALSTADAGATWQVVGCVDVSAEMSHLTGTAGRLIASNPDRTLHSTDAAVTWN